MRKTQWIAALAVLCAGTSCRQTASPADYTAWTTYAGSKDGIRYSSAEDINTANVTQLQVAWTYSTHDRDTANRSQNQCTPLMIGGIVYGVSPRLKLFALEAARGRQLWLFDPAREDSVGNGDPYAFYKVSRGIAYWKDEAGSEARLFYSVGARTYAIDASNGKPVKSFGKGGFIYLSDSLDRDVDPDTYISGTTPGIVYKDLLIIGTRVAESADAAPGHIRAYDVRTGERRWIFHTIPFPGEQGYDSWPDKDAWKKLGGANNWAGLSLDERRGIVYVPTGSVAGDFYGGFRKGTNLFANSLVALDAATGKYLWHYQTVHHDLWDRDLSANPNLVTLKRDGKRVDAVAQITKQGYIFVFDRTTGKPLFPIQERPVSQQALPGEEPWPTQPVPTLPEPFARQRFDSNDLTDRTPEARADMLAQYRKIKYAAAFTPPSKEGSWIFPGFDGGGEWGGAAVDPETGILYVNSSELPWALVMIDVPKNKAGDRSLKGSAMRVYNRYCISCHGPELKGNSPSYPSLRDVYKRLTEEQVRKVIENGRNMMPAFRQLPENEKGALVAFLMNGSGSGGGDKGKDMLPKEPGGGEADHLPAGKNILDEVPYTMTGYNRFLDKDGYPGIKPPWGTLNAVDLNSGKLLWKVPLGEYDELKKKGWPATGTENYGGPLVTKGGLVFIAATKDAKIRAFSKESGKVLWEASLPVPGYATPATYVVNGRQYVVIACGGGKIGSPSGDQYIAFALPEKK